MFGDIPGDEAERTYGDPVVTLQPHVETPLKQSRITEPVRCPFVLCDADSIPCFIFDGGGLLRVAQFGRWFAGGRIYR